jgi:hypothetical protein
MFVTGVDGMSTGGNAPRTAVGKRGLAALWGADERGRVRAARLSQNPGARRLIEIGRRRSTRRPAVRCGAGGAVAGGDHTSMTVEVYVFIGGRVCVLPVSHHALILFRVGNRTDKSDFCAR